MAYVITYVKYFFHRPVILLYNAYFVVCLHNLLDQFINGKDDV